LGLTCLLNYHTNYILFAVSLYIDFFNKNKRIKTTLVSLYYIILHLAVVTVIR
jgi:hypothetical protein